ncbi:YqaJ viral recombinase family protein [Ruania sp. N2-46]|uniref:YqaJ viral recombinase family protein n=2 Tax=Occultella gossypii TaxID=2800820 RepID=A0ABS7SAX4_9MICO|nr:YqaJ viral recombinase family protein [Occultella gossypii]
MHPGRAKAARDGAATAAPVLSVTPAAEARPWLATLAAERITGHVEQTPTTKDMWRGIDSEPYARDAYSEHRAPVVEVGFVTRDLGGGLTIGYSPDGLVGNDGLIEIKAPRAKGHLLTAVEDTIPTQYMAQLQTGLLVTGRQWIDYISFAGGMALWCKRVTPIPQWQEALTFAARTAEGAINELTERYRAAVNGLPVMERIPDADEIEF